MTFLYVQIFGDLRGFAYWEGIRANSIRIDVDTDMDSPRERYFIRSRAQRCKAV